MSTPDILLFTGGNDKFDELDGNYIFRCTFACQKPKPQADAIEGPKQSFHGHQKDGGGGEKIIIIIIESTASTVRQIGSKIEAAAD